MIQQHLHHHLRRCAQLSGKSAEIIPYYLNLTGWLYATSKDCVEQGATRQLVKKNTIITMDTGIHVEANQLV